MALATSAAGAAVWAAVAYARARRGVGAGGGDADAPLESRAFAPPASWLEATALLVDALRLLSGELAAWRPGDLVTAVHRLARRDVTPLLAAELAACGAHRVTKARPRSAHATPSAPPRRQAAPRGTRSGAADAGDRKTLTLGALPFTFPAGDC
jgi:hypothetical protein